MLKEIIRLGDDQGLNIAQELIIDSTPIEKKNMDQATYNPKYDMKCVKYHNLRCAQTGIPLDYHVSHGTEYDGNMFVPLIYRLKTIQGVKPIRVFGDGHYSSGKNMMQLREYFGVEVICNIADNWIIKGEADIKALKRSYQKFWKEDDFKMDANIEHIKWYLIMHEKTEVLENYYHNQVLRSFQRNPDKYMSMLKVRSSIEHGHGLEKKHTELKNIQASDLDTFEIHLGMHVISRLTLALMRLQNGISENLLNLGGII